MNIPTTFLTEAIDSDSILRILSNKNKQIDKTNQYYNKLASWANTRQLKIKNVDLTKIDLSDRSLIGEEKLINRYNSLGSLLDRLKNLMDQEGRYNPNDAKSKLIQQTTLEILAGLSGIKDTNTPPPEEPEEPDNTNLHEGMDWTAEKARRLAEAKETGEAVSSVLDKFYNDYYRVEYASGTDDTIVAKLKSLDKILIPEFNALGYNPDVNPLAQFLKILIKLQKENKANIFNKLTTNTYGAIHNSFISKSITGNMLGNYSEENILFCADLYNHNGLDMVNYLSLQNQAIIAAERDVKYSDDRNLIAKMFIQQPILDKNYAENIKKLFDDPVAIKTIEITSPGNPNAKLKSESEIRELYRHLFKSVPKKAVTPKVTEEILERAKEANVVLSMIRYILDQNEFISNNKYVKFAQDTEKWLKITFNYSRDGNEEKISDSKKILADYTLNADAENLIVRQLREYAEKVKAKEEADK